MENAHLTSIFEHSTEGIVLTRGRGPVVLLNPAAERMFGYAADEVVGQNIEILIPSRFKHRHVELRDGFALHPQNRVMGRGRDLYGKKKDGSEFPVEVSLSFYTKDDELFVIAFIVDITLRKSIEEELVRQQEELKMMATNLKDLNADLENKVENRTQVLKRALQQLEISQIELNEALQKEKQLNEVKSRFMSIASHEFRTPLSTVLSSASLLEKYATGEDQPKRERHVEKIKNSVRSLNGILEDFLSLGKLEEGKIAAAPASFNVQEMMMGTIEEMNSLLKPGQQFVVEQTGATSIVADQRLLKNILINLITNAIKFSAEGDKIIIYLNTAGNQLEIKVKDSGIGIPEEDKKELFSSFHRARNASNIQGTGLGLHIVKRYLELLEGDIMVESELGKGSIFTITIPVAYP